MQILNYFPGQKVTIFLETINNLGVRTDSSTTPIVSRIVFPGFTLASDYPQTMIQLDTGLYYYQFTLPSGAVSVGSYFVDVIFTNPSNDALVTTGYHILVSAPFGNFSTTIG